MKILQLSITLMFMVSNAYAGDRSYCVQVSRCVQVESAIHVYDALKAYETARLEKINGTYVVSVGSFSTKAKAASLQAQLKKEYPDAFVRAFTKTDMQVVRGYQPVQPNRERISQALPIRNKLAKEDTPVKPQEKKTAQSASASPMRALTSRASGPLQAKANPLSAQGGLATKPQENKIAQSALTVRGVPGNATASLQAKVALPPIGGDLPTKPQEKKMAPTIPSVRNISAEPSPLIQVKGGLPTAGGDLNAKPPTKQTAQSVPLVRDVPVQADIPSQGKGNPSLATVSKPDLATAPALKAEGYFKNGMQNYRDLKYTDAIGSLSQYISISPNGNQCPAALFLIARSLEALNRPLSALMIFGRILDQCPQSTEASLSIIAMADIGVAHPALSYPTFMRGAEYFKNPIFAYDTALTKKIPAAMVEDTLLHKGLALWKGGHYRETYDTLVFLLKEYPNTLRHKEITGTLKACTAILIDQNHKTGDHVAAANYYFQSRGKWGIPAEDSDIKLKAAISLAHMGFYDLSTDLISALKGNVRGKASPDIDNAVAEIEKIKIANASEQLPGNANWELFQSGREQLRANNRPAAEENLSKLKNAGGEAFWAKITDYAFADQSWSQKYRGYLGGKH